MSDTRVSNGPMNGTSSNGVEPHSVGALTTAQKQQQLLALRHQQQLKQKKLRGYEFAYTSEEILKKYAKYPPSMTFHIFENHYRFNNSSDSNIIPKDSPMVKDFMHHVLREEIPIEMSELIKDFAIKAYDGCIMLQVYDHRNMIPTGADAGGTTTAGTTATGSTTKPDSETNGTGPKGASTGSGTSNGSQTNGNQSGSEPTATGPSKPKTYRTILRPTQLSLYYDLLYHTDSALTKFTDPLSLQMESEILTLTNRKLDLSVPLNPYTQDDILHPETEFPKKVWDEKQQDYQLVHSHREAMEKPPRKLHQDEMVLHKSSEYEEIMFLLSNKYKRTDDSEKKLVVVGGSNLRSLAGNSGSNSSGGTSSVAPGSPGTPGLSKEGTVEAEIKAKKTDLLVSSSIGGGPSSNLATTGQFMRLRFIEDIRKRKEAQKVQKDATVAMQAQSSGINTINQNNNIGQSPEKLMNGKSSHTSTPQMAQQPMPQQIQRPPISNPRMVSQKPSPVPQTQSPALGHAPGAVPRQNIPPQMQQAQAQTAQAAQAQLRLQQQRQMAQQQLTQQQRQAQQQQFQSQQAAKRQKVAGQMNPGQQQHQQFNQNYQSPQMANTAISNNVPGSANGMGTPNANMATTAGGMGRGVPNQRMQQLQQQMPVNNQNQNRLAQNGAVPGSGGNQFMPSSTVATGSGTGAGASSNTGLSNQARQVFQQQQQQLLQSMLSPQEQASFKSFQGKMNILINMGQTGVAPNKSRLNPQQQQAAIQQAKQIQQSLVQKFPAYFQRLRQLQMARQRAQQQGQNMAQNQNIGGNISQNQNLPQNMSNMQNSMAQTMNQGMSQPQMSQGLGMQNGMQNIPMQSQISPQFSPSMMMAQSPMQSSPAIQSPMNQFMDYDDDKKRKYKR